MLILALAACGGEEPSNVTDRESSDNEDAVVTTAAAEEETAEFLIDFDFENVGNNPNNFWQSEFAPAFDDEYIYYVVQGKLSDKIYRVSYSGGVPELVIEEEEGCSYLNIYEGDLYYTVAGVNSIPFARLMKLDLETNETVKLFEHSGKKLKNYFSYSSILITDGYAFFATIDDYIGDTLIMAVDVNDPNKSYFLGYEGEARGVEFTTDCEGNVYALMKTDGSNANRRKLLSVNIESMKNNYVMFEPVVGEKDLPPFATFVWGKNGYAAYDGGYLNYYYDEINTTELKWYPGERNYMNPEADTLADKILSTRGQRFVVGNSLVVFGTDIVFNGSDVLGDASEGLPIFIFKNLDMTEPVEIARSKGITFSNNDPLNVFGTYKDKLYIIETVDDAKTLITIDQDGNVTKNVIEQQ